MLNIMFQTVLLILAVINCKFIIIHANPAGPTLSNNQTNVELYSSSSSQNESVEDQIRSPRGTYGVPKGPILSSYGVSSRSGDIAYGVPQELSTNYGEPSKSYGPVKNGYSGKPNFGGMIKLGLLDSFKVLKAGIFGLKTKVIQTTANILQKKSDALLEFANAKDHQIGRTNGYDKPKYSAPLPPKVPESYGVPIQPPESYGVPSKPPQSYGVPSKPPQSYGVPSQPPHSYGVPTQPPQSYGVPNKGSDYHIQKPPQSYGAPHQALDHHPPNFYGVPDRTQDYQIPKPPQSYRVPIQEPEYRVPSLPQSYVVQHQGQDYSDQKFPQSFGVPNERPDYSAPTPPQFNGINNQAYELARSFASASQVSNYPNQKHDEIQSYGRDDSARTVSHDQSYISQGPRLIPNDILQNYETEKTSEIFGSKSHENSINQNLPLNEKYLEPAKPTNYGSSESLDDRNYRKYQRKHQTISQPRYKALKKYNKVVEIQDQNVPLTTYSMYVANAAPSKTTFTDAKNNTGSIFYWSNVQLGQSGTAHQVTVRRRKKPQKSKTNASVSESIRVEKASSSNLRRKRRKNVNKSTPKPVHESIKDNQKQSGLHMQNNNFSIEEPYREEIGPNLSESVNNSRSDSNEETATESYITSPSEQGSESDVGSNPMQNSRILSQIESEDLMVDDEIPKGMMSSEMENIV